MVVTSNSNFSKALLILNKFDDIGAMMEVLYNMIMNAILLEDYQSADSYVNACIYAIENIRKDERINVVHISKLYGYKALCCYYLDDLYTGKFYLSYEKRLLDHILESDEEVDEFGLWYDELFVYHYVKGIICIKDELYEMAKEYLDKALVYSEKAGALRFFSYVRCQIELARIYLIFEKKSEAVNSLKKAIEFANKEDLKKQKLKALRILKGITGEDNIAEEEEMERVEFISRWSKIYARKKVLQFDMEETNS